MTLTRMFQEHPVSLVKMSFSSIQVKLMQVLDFDNWHPLNESLTNDIVNFEQLGPEK